MWEEQLRCEASDALWRPLERKKRDEPCGAFEKAAPGGLQNVSANHPKSHSVKARK